MTEDEVIAHGLSLIRQGIVGLAWQSVLDGYNSISGEELVLPEQKAKSRLENIRELMNVSVEKTEKIEKKKPLKPTKTPKRKKTPKEAVQEPSIISISESTAQGGKRFGIGEIKFISDEFDPDEAADNQALKNNKPRVLSYERSSSPKDTSTDPNKDSRFYDKPPKSPPWR